MLQICMQLYAHIGAAAIVDIVLSRLFASATSIEFIFHK